MRTDSKQVEDARSSRIK